MEIIKDGNLILAIIHRAQEWKEGLDFLTPGDLFVQAGTWRYAKGKRLDSHMHQDYERKTFKTQEVVYIRKGSIRATLFNQARAKIKEFELHTGDLAIFANGGHGYEILEDDTQVLEVKNGPFVNVELDKVKF